MKRSPDDASLVLRIREPAREGRAGSPMPNVRLRDLLAKDPLDANALNSLGYLLADHGQRLDEAVDLVQRALKIEPANPSFLDSLGWAYFRQGKLDLRRPAADAGGVEAAGELGDQRSPRRSPLQAAAVCRRGGGVGAFARRRRRLHRSRHDREEGARRAGARRAVARVTSRTFARGSSPAASAAPLSSATAGCGRRRASRFRLAPARRSLTSPLPIAKPRPTAWRSPDLSASIKLSGRAGSTKLSARIDCRVCRAARLRLEGLPAHQLRRQAVFHPRVARRGQHARVMPRDARVLRGAAPAAIIEALAGVALGPGDLRSHRRRMRRCRRSSAVGRPVVRQRLGGRRRGGRDRVPSSDRGPLARRGRAARSVDGRPYSDFAAGRAATVRVTAGRHRGRADCRSLAAPVATGDQSAARRARRSRSRCRVTPRR